MKRHRRRFASTASLTAARTMQPPGHPPPLGASLPTSNRSMRQMMALVKRVRRADGRFADGITEGVGQGMQGPPAGAVAADDVTDLEWLQALDRVRDHLLHDAAQVQPTHQGVD